MTPLEIVQRALGAPFQNEGGEPVRLELLPGLSADEIGELAAELPCPLPGEVRELLHFCRGFDGFFEQVDFTGRDIEFEAPAIFPDGLPIAADGFGNFWVVDLTPSSRAFGPIYFACHDAPVILLQSPTFEHFLTELFKLNVPPHASAVNDVHEDRLFQVWRKNPGVLEHAQCLASGDPELSAFARELGPSFEVIDLRECAVGFGFSWGRDGPQTVVRRHGELPIFACEHRQGLLSRLFRRFRAES